MATPILSLTVDPQTTGENNGFSNEEIFILITGKKSDIYHFLDWESGEFVKMSKDHNTVPFDFLAFPQKVIPVLTDGPDPQPVFDAEGNAILVKNSLGHPVEIRQKYASYGKSLSEILALQRVIDNEGRIPIPTPIEGARVYISFLKPIFLHIDAGGQPAEPADQDWKDPNYATIWDKFEFTSDDPDKKEVPQLWSNTSCVDFVGIPLEFKLEHGEGSERVEAGPQGFNIPANEKDDPMGFIKAKFLEGVENAQIQDLEDEAVEKLFTPYRIFSPKVHGSHFEPEFGSDGSYLDNYIEDCWGIDFDSPGIELRNFVNVKRTEHNEIPSELDENNEEIGVKPCQWIVHGNIVGDNLVFTLSSLSFDSSGDGTPDTPLTLPTKADGSPIEFSIGKPTSNEVLSQGGAPFTKHDFKNPPEDHPEFNKNYICEIDGDIKNQVSTALNRSVMHMAPDQTNPNAIWWAEVADFYAKNGLADANYKPNFYAQVLHPLCHENKCYALPYDDKHDQQVQLNIPVSVETDNPIVETKVTLSAFYKREATGGQIEAKEETDGHTPSIVSAGVEPNPDLGEDVAVIWLKSDLDIEVAWVMYEPEAFGIAPANFPASVMEKKGDRFELNFIPESLLRPSLLFWIKYQITNDDAQKHFPAGVEVDPSKLISVTLPGPRESGTAQGIITNRKKRENTSSTRNNYNYSKP